MFKYGLLLLGYEGHDCSILVNPCDSKPCVNGVCSRVGLTDYTCDCIPGWEGARYV